MLLWDWDPLYVLLLQAYVDGFDHHVCAILELQKS